MCNFVVLIRFPDLLFFINLFQLYEIPHNPELDKRKNMDESMDAQYKMTQNKMTFLKSRFFQPVSNEINATRNSKLQLEIKSKDL